MGAITVVTTLACVVQRVDPSVWSTSNWTKFSEQEIAARARYAQEFKEWFWSEECPKPAAWKRWQDDQKSPEIREKAYRSLVAECSVSLNKLGVKGVPIFARLGYFRCVSYNVLGAYQGCSTCM